MIKKDNKDKRTIILILSAVLSFKLSNIMTLLANLKLVKTSEAQSCLICLHPVVTRRFIYSYGQFLSNFKKHAESLRKNLWSSFKTCSLFFSFYKLVSWLYFVLHL